MLSRFGGAALGLVLAAQSVVPAAAQEIVLSELDRTGGIALLLALVRIDIAAINCNVTITAAQGRKLDENLVILADQLAYSDEDYTNIFYNRAVGIYERDTPKFCGEWGPQVRPLIDALAPLPGQEADATPADQLAGTNAPPTPTEPVPQTDSGVVIPTDPAPIAPAPAL